MNRYYEYLGIFWGGGSGSAYGSFIDIGAHQDFKKLEFFMPERLLKKLWSCFLNPYPTPDPFLDPPPDPDPPPDHLLDPPPDPDPDPFPNILTDPFPNPNPLHPPS